jgi:hypothetical protein
VNLINSIHHFITKTFESQLWPLLWQIIQETAVDHSDIYNVLHNAVPQFYAERSIS